MEVKDSGFNLPNPALLRRWGEDFPLLHLFFLFWGINKQPFLVLLVHLYLIDNITVSN